MTDKQPEALSIAKRLKNQQQPLSLALREKAAAELRRLHEVNAELVEALNDLVNEIGDGFMPHQLFVDQALAALAKAQGETALQRLNKAAEDNGEPL